MASIIRIKRSSVSGNPATLGAGELAYSALTDNGSNGGDRLYIGIGTETAGNAVNHYVIGGKYFTDMLDHTPGTLTASSALVVDASSKINNINVGNLTLTGSTNTISSTNTNGDILITPNGSGKTIISNAYIGDNATTLAEFIYDTVGGAVTGTAGQISVTNSDVGNTSTISLATTAVTAGSYGSASAIPTFTVDAYGRLTAAGTASISTSLTVAADSGTADAVALGVDTLTFTGGTGLDSAVTNNTITFNIDSTVATLTGSQTLTNKTISGASNTLSNIGNSSLTNSSVTINGTSVSLGGTATVTAAAGTLTGATLNSTVTASSLTSVGTIATGVWQGTAIANAYLANSAVTIGSTSVSLGGTATAIAGITELTVDNLNFNGNTIISTDANGDIILSPNGTGKVDISGSILTGLSEPVNPTDATTKNYVDTIAQGLHVHEAARVATTDTLATLSGGTVTYANGTLGVGATLTLSVGLTGLDGITLANGDRILVKNQANAAHNGLYVRTSSTVLTRALDFDSAAEIAGGDFTFVEVGTLFGKTGWVQVIEVNTVGTDLVTFEQFAGQNLYLAGNGLVLTGNQFDVVGTADRITANANSIDIASTYVGQTTITTVGTIGTGTWAGSLVAGQYGGTGVNNSGKTITLGGNLTTSGAFATTLTSTANTSVTLPTTGTLATLAGSETFTNKTLTSPAINTATITGGTISALTGLAVRDTSAAFDVTIAAVSSTALTAGRTLTLDVVNAARTIKIAGNIDLAANFTTSGANALTLTTTGATNVTLPTTGTLVNSAVTTLSSLVSVGTITTGTWQGTAIASGYGGTGFTTYATGDIIYASAANTLAKRAAGTDGQILQMNASGVPVWGDVDGGTY